MILFFDFTLFALKKLNLLEYVKLKKIILIIKACNYIILIFVFCFMSFLSSIKWRLTHCK